MCGRDAAQASYCLQCQDSTPAAVAAQAVPTSRKHWATPCTLQVTCLGSACTVSDSFTTCIPIHALCCRLDMLALAWLGALFILYLCCADVVQHLVDLLLCLLDVVQQFVDFAFYSAGYVHRQYKTVKTLNIGTGKAGHRSG